MPDRTTLQQYRSLPMQAKIYMSQARIREWYDHWNGDVYISFSGGKDSTVLACLVHEFYPDVPLVFSNTGLEYPEIQRFARETGAEFVRPEMSFPDVLTNLGYPIISKEVAEAVQAARRTDGKKWAKAKRAEFLGKRKNKGEKSAFCKEKWLPLCTETDFRISHFCCHVMKKNPLKAYEKRTGRKPFIGNLAEESRLREEAWLAHGCNAFDIQRQVSQPMAFWREQDVLEYLLENNVKIASVYGKIIAVDENGYEYEAMAGAGQKLMCSGCNRTGCIFCAFSTYREKGETKFQKLAKTHPKQYEYCMGGGNMWTIRTMIRHCQRLMRIG